MKRLAFALLTVGALVACNALEHPTAAKHADSVAAHKDGEPCKTDDGRSGYVVTSGFQTYCQPNP